MEPERARSDHGAPYPEFRCKSAFNNVTALNSTSNNSFPGNLWDQCDVTNPVTNVSTPCDQGFDYSIPLENSIVTEWDLVCSKGYVTEISQTLFTVGQCIGTTVSTFVADRYGRKWVSAGNLWATMALGVAVAFSQSPIAFILLRFAIGISQSGFISLTDVITMETVPTANRSFLSLLGNALWATAVTVFSGIGYLCQDIGWRYTQIILTAPLLIVLINMAFLEETFRWRLAQRRYQSVVSAVKNAARMNGKEGDPVVDAFILSCEEKSALNTAELPGKFDKGTLGDDDRKSKLKTAEHPAKCDDCTNELSITLIGENTEEKISDPNSIYSPVELIRHPKLRLFTLVMGFTWSCHGWVYLGLFWTSSSLAGDPYLNLFLNAVVEIPGALVIYFSIVRIGRKGTAVIFNGLAALALLISSVLQITTGSSGSSAITAFSIIGKFANAVAFGSLFTYTPELFPTTLRSVGIGVAGTCSRVGQMMSSYSKLLLRVSPWLPSILYSAVSLLSALLFMLLPETKAKSLPQTLNDVESWFKAKTETPQSAEHFHKKGNKHLSQSAF